MTIYAIHSDPTAADKGIGEFEMEGYVSIVADNGQPIAEDLPVTFTIVDREDWSVIHIAFKRNRRDIPSFGVFHSEDSWLWPHLRYDHRVIERAIWRRRQEQEERDV